MKSGPCRFLGENLNFWPLGLLKFHKFQNFLLICKLPFSKPFWTIGIMLLLQRSKKPWSFVILVILIAEILQILKLSADIQVAFLKTFWSNLNYACTSIIREVMKFCSVNQVDNRSEIHFDIPTREQVLRMVESCFQCLYSNHLSGNRESNGHCFRCSGNDLRFTNRVSGSVLGNRNPDLFRTAYKWGFLIFSMDRITD